MAEYVAKEQIIDWFSPYGHLGKPIPFETLVSDLRGMEAADVEPVQQWIPVTERLPGREGKSQPWKKYNVVVLRSHWPTSSYDLCDAPYDEEIVTTASYDSEQKIWHLDWGAQLNALIDIEDSPLNGDYVTHWMPLPEPPKGE